MDTIGCLPLVIACSGMFGTPWTLGNGFVAVQFLGVGWIGDALRNDLALFDCIA